MLMKWGFKMKILDYNHDPNPSMADSLLIDGAGGTRQTMIRDLPFDDKSLLKKASVRGGNLGTSVTAEQYAAIADGSFDGLYLGDFWEIDSNRWRIVDFDYWYGKAYDVLTHHVVLMPDMTDGHSAMYTTATNAGGYVGSYIYTSYLPAILENMYNRFGQSHILAHTTFYTNEIDSTGVRSCVWQTARIEIPNVYMMFGNHPYGLGEPTESMTQFLLFQYEPEKIIANHRYWLRTTFDTTSFMSVIDTGVCLSGSSNEDFYIRPVFGLCA